MIYGAEKNRYHRNKKLIYGMMEPPDGSRNILNIGTIEWKSYYEWLLTGLDRNSHPLTLPFIDTHKTKSLKAVKATDDNLPLLYPVRPKRKIAQKRKTTTGTDRKSVV